MSKTEIEKVSNSTKKFKSRPWRSPLERYLEACTEPSIKGFILVRGRSDKDEERCFIPTASFKQEAELPDDLYTVLTSISAPIQGLMLSYVRFDEEGFIYSNSLASIFALKIWLGQEIKTAWEKFSGTKSLCNTLLCALEFLRQTDSPSETRKFLEQAFDRAFLKGRPDTDEFWDFLTLNQEYLCSDILINREQRQFGQTMAWIPNGTLPVLREELEEVLQGLPLPIPASPPPLPLQKPHTDDQMVIGIKAMDDPPSPVLPGGTRLGRRPMNLNPKKK